MRRVVAALLALVLAACTYQAQVPSVDGSALARVGARQPGRYAALVQSGGWAMTSDIVGLNCWAHTFQADLNPVWNQAMRGALTTALEKVDFVTKTIPNAELGTKGYDAQISLMQTNASSIIRVDSRFLHAIANSEMIIEAILIVSFPDGSRQQQSIKARGVSRYPTFGCGQVDIAIGESGAYAIRALVERIAITTKLLLAQKVPR